MADRRRSSKKKRAAGISAGAVGGAAMGAPAGLLAALALMARNPRALRIKAPKGRVAQYRYLKSDQFAKDLDRVSKAARRRAIGGVAAGAGGGAALGGMAGHEISKHAAALYSRLTPTSSNVRGFSYDAKSGDLVVTYKSGGTYRYKGVPQNVARSMVRNKSVGKTVHKRIKGGGFEYEKVGARKLFPARPAIEIARDQIKKRGTRYSPGELAVRAKERGDVLQEISNEMSKKGPLGRWFQRRVSSVARGELPAPVAIPRATARFTKESAKLAKSYTCKFCKEPATKGVLWAEGRAIVPACDKHLAKAKGSVDEIDAIRDLTKTSSIRLFRKRRPALDIAKSEIDPSWMRHMSDAEKAKAIQRWAGHVQRRTNRSQGELAASVMPQARLLKEGQEASGSPNSNGTLQQGGGENSFVQEKVRSFLRERVREGGEKKAGVEYRDKSDKPAQNRNDFRKSVRKQMKKFKEKKKPSIPKIAEEKRITCRVCSWSWRASDSEASDVMNCHRCGGKKTGMIKSGGDNLFDNIRAKRARGEKPAKPGDKDYPDSKTWKKVTKEAAVALKKEHKNPKGGLTAKGRSAYNKATGSNLKPGVKGKADTPEKMRRKGSFLSRMFGPGAKGPMTKPNGEPSRRALSAAAWGEPVPKNDSDRARLYAKGQSLLKRYGEMKKSANVDGGSVVPDEAGESMVVEPLPVPKLETPVSPKALEQVTLEDPPPFLAEAEEKVAAWIFAKAAELAAQDDRPRLPPNPGASLSAELERKTRAIKKLAGAAKKQVTWQGITMKLEYEKGDKRSGVNKATGKKWERTMRDNYGYMPGTYGKGADGEAIDVYFNPAAGEEKTKNVYKIRQKKKDGSYDEDKFMVGYASATDAKKAFLRNMPEWAFGSMTAVSMGTFKRICEPRKRNAS